MRPIPPKMREQMSQDSFYKVCAVTGITNEKIEWHHNLIFAGRQVNEVWAIIPLSEWIHARANDRNVRKVLDWIMLNRATDEQLKLYSKARNLIAERDRLNKELGYWDAYKYPYKLV